VNSSRKRNQAPGCGAVRQWFVPCGDRAKSCMREETDFSDGYRQIKNHMHEIPSLFQYNAFCIISDLIDSKVGTITAGLDRFVDWKTVDGNYEETQFA